MDNAAVSYRGEELRAWPDDSGWTVQFGALEAWSRYLDLALASLLDDEADVHQLAARLVAELEGGGDAFGGPDEPIAVVQ